MITIAWYWLVLGAFLVFWLGFLMAALCRAAGEGDRWEEHRKNLKEGGKDVP